MGAETQNENGSASTQIELRICANPEYLGVVRMAVRQVATTVGMAKDKTESVTLAVVEALTNVIRHGYGGPCDKPIIVKLSKVQSGEKNKPALEILIRDFGRQVDVGLIEGRDLDEIRPGGLGVHIIQSVMDEIEFSHADDCGMKLRMVEYIT